MPVGAQDQQQREVSEADKRLAADWLKRIESAVGDRFEKDFKRFDTNRKLLRGIDPKTGEKMLANLHFANLAMMRPQVYAKDPEYSVKPSRAVPPERLKLFQRFGTASEALLAECLVKRAKLKKRAKRLLTGAFTTSVGWWKLCWQEDKRTDPLIINQIKDTQDNLMRLEQLRREVDDAKSAAEMDLNIGKLKQTLAGLEGKAEVSVARGLTLDFVLSEDVIPLDDSVLELGDYERSEAIAHRVWMTRDQYKQRFGYDCAKGKAYTSQSSGAPTAGSKEQKRDLLCTYEVWDQASNRVLHVCDGEEGFCREPFTPDWTGERWYPFFMLAFNEVEGGFYPLADVELTEGLVREYNDTRTDFRRDRKYALPLNIVRKGGSLTDEDVKKISNREGGDTLVVEGVGGQPISNDVWSGQLATIRPENYNTDPARADIEMLIGGGDAARGTVLKAKTATEAEILSQGLRGRSAERQDTMEDVLSEVGAYALQVLLRKLTPKEVAEIAGAEAAEIWPTASDPERIFRMLTVDVRGGSTGKPDRLQEQDRWTKLLPVIEKAMAQVAELRAQPMGEQQAQAIIALIKETLRRFDERIDIEQFLPAPKDGEEPAQPADPTQDPRVVEMLQQGQQIVQELQAEIQKLQQQLADKQTQAAADVEKARIGAEKDIQVAQITAPIEAQAKVDVARVNAEMQAAAQAQINQEKAERQAAEQAAKAEDTWRSDTEQSLAGMVEMQQAMQALLDKLSAPRPRMKVVHDVDPKTNRISASRLVPDEETQE